MSAAAQRLLIGAATLAASAAVALQAQNREWTTANGDAQKNSWVRTDPRLTKDAVQRGELKFLWKTKLNGETRQLNSLTQPILLDRLISHRGFKALAFVGTSSERIFAIDTDLNKIYWEHVINYSSIAPPANSTWECPGGLTAAFTRPTLVAPPAFGAARGGGRSGSSVGEPGRGAPSLQASQAGRGRGNDPTPPAPGRANAPATPAAPQGRGAPSPGNGGGPTENVFVLASDGLVRALNTHNGTERFPAMPFVPANARAAGLILADGVLYTATSNGCGSVPNGVYALDVNLDAPKPVSWQTGGPSVAGSAGPALGTDGTIYVATTEASSGPARASDSKATVYANSVVALEPKTLKVKDWFMAPNADFNASPVVFRHGTRDLVVASGNDGRLYVLDGSSLGGSDHKTALHVTGRFTRPGVAAGVSTWEDQGTRWILAPMDGPPDSDGPARTVPAEVLSVVPRLPGELGVSQLPETAPPGRGGAPPPRPTGAIVGFKLSEQNGRITLERAWSSRAMTAPLTPVVFNGTVFAVASGERRSPADARLTAAQRAQRSVPAVLYALDPATGKELWNSGRTITSFARAGLSASAGQVYLVTFDNTLYAFGIPMEH
jgi:outer membrane protein assembly factor BamB